MKCLTSSIPVELYWTLIAVAVGAVVRGAKMLPVVKANALPALAFVVGWAIDVGIGYGSCGETLSGAALTGLAGGLAGLAAAGGHEAFVRSAGALGMQDVAERLLGKAESEKDAQRDPSAGSEPAGDE